MKMTAITVAIVSVFLFTSMVMADLTWVTKSNNFATFTEANLDRVISYSAAGDRRALQKMVEKEKTAFFLKSGVRVYVEETSWTKVRIRPEGETWSIWTVRDALHK